MELEIQELKLLSVKNRIKFQRRMLLNSGVVAKTGFQIDVCVLEKVQ